MHVLRQTLSRRSMLQQAVGAAALLALPGARLFAQSGEGAGSGDSSGSDDQRRRAAEKGLAWLAQKQREDGAFEGGKFSADPAIVALAGRAFLAAGSVPGRGEYGAPLARCVEYLTSHVEGNGYIRVHHDGTASSMYSHGYATAFLAAGYRASMDEALRRPIERATVLLVEAQSDEGGWRYVPNKASGADASITSCQLLALTAAKEAGIDVPDKTIEAAASYLADCQNDDGGFRYQRTTRAESALPRSAAALAALESAGRSTPEVVRRGREYLDSQRGDAGEAWRQPHFCYTAYFSAQAMCSESNKGHRVWREWLTGAMLAARQEDGSWPDAAIGPAYATAIACYVLNFPQVAM